MAEVVIFIREACINNGLPLRAIMFGNGRSGFLAAMARIFARRNDGFVSPHSSPRLDPRGRVLVTPSREMAYFVTHFKGWNR